jgi:hypothetical protein
MSLAIPGQASPVVPLADAGFAITRVKILFSGPRFEFRGCDYYDSSVRLDNFEPKLAPTRNYFLSFSASSPILLMTNLDISR